MDEPTRTIKYTWKLENFCFCDFYSNTSLNSPTFKVSVPVTCEWCLYMFPNGHGLQKYVGIYLKRSKTDRGPEKIPVRFKISLLDNDGCLCPDASAIDQVFTKGCEWGHNEFIKRSELNTGCPYLHEDILTVFCQITIIDPSFSGRIPRQISSQPGVSEKNRCIYNAIKLMYEEKLHSDMCLKSKTKTFSVHKCILRARLPGLFNKLKSKPDTILSDDFLTEKIILYAYGDKLDIKHVNPFNLKQSLQEYGLLHLEKELMSQSEEYYGLTYFSIKTCVYSWKILKSLLTEENEIASPFISDGFQTDGFFVWLIKEEKGEWRIYLKALKSSNDDIFVRCNISVRNPNRSVPVTCEHNYTSNNFWKSPFTLRLENDVLYFNDLPNCLNSDFFCLDFKFQYPSGKVESSLQQVYTDHTSFTDYNNDSEKLLLNLEQLYCNQYESDTTICVEEREFRVHKCILCARSSYFRAMFTHDMKEKEDNRVELKCDEHIASTWIDEPLNEQTFAEVVDKLLLFTYCGKFDAKSPKFASLLLGAIKMYMIGEDY